MDEAQASLIDGRREAGNAFHVVAPYDMAGDQPQAVEKLAKGVKDGLRYQTLLGVTGSGKTFTMAKVIEKVQMPTLVLAPNKTLAAQLASELREFFPDNAVNYFVSYYDYYQPEAYVPQTDTYIEKDSSINEEVEKMRHAATAALLTRKDVIIVASVSCIYGIGSPQNYADMSVFLDCDVPMDRDDFIYKLIEMQYDRNDYELERGTFRVRGDVVDVFPPYMDDMLRIEFFGDEIESITQVNRVTGEEVMTYRSVPIWPASHYVTSRPSVEKALVSISDELRQRLGELKENGKLDVGGAIGNGVLGVIKDLKLKEPYVGQVPLQTGEIGDDIAFYFMQSEQVPSVVALGVLVDRDYSIKCAGGFIIQVMPECDEKSLSKLENSIGGLMSVTEMLSKSMTPEEIIKYVMLGFDVDILEEESVRYNCGCSKERMETALVSLGRDTLQEMIDDGKGAELACHFCDNKYSFDTEDLIELQKRCKR